MSLRKEQNTRFTEGGADFADMQNYLNDFIHRKGWEKYKTPKNISMALTVEAAELMEIFQWMTPHQSVAAKSDPKLRERIEQELADVFSYVMQLATALDIDMREAFWRKAKLNEQKFASVKPGDPVLGRRMAEIQD